MNILIIDNSLAFTGALKCAVNEAELLSPQHRFIFVIHKNSNVNTYLRDKGIKYYAINMLEIRKSPAVFLYPFVLLYNTFRIRSIIKKESIDIVQSNDFYNLLGVAAKITGFKGKLITYVRFIPSVMPAFLRKVWTGLAQKFSYKVIAVSDTVLNQLPYRPNTIRIYDSANLEEKIITPQQHSNEEIQLLYLSNYIRGKGQDYALEAFIKAYSKNPKLRLKFTGGDMGLDKNKLFKQLLVEKVQELSLQNVVSFTSFNHNIEAEIKSADIVLNFSNSESLSMTCIEAAYFGTPLIATRCGGPEEIIKHKETGLLVAVADIDAMTEAILTLAADKELRLRYAKAGMIYVREKFSKEDFITRFQKMLIA